jgi:hypothetical protein
MRLGPRRQPSASETPVPGGRRAQAAAFPKLVVAGRVALLLIAVAAVGFAFLRGRPEASPAAGPQASYACPMHPEVTAAGPGPCPICGMDLRELAAPGPAPAPSDDPLGLRERGVLDVARRRVLAQEVRAPAWAQAGGAVVALVSDDDLEGLVPGQRGVFRPTARPAARVDLRLAGGPPVAWDAATSRIELRQGPTAPALRAGTAGWVELPIPPRAALVIPSSAVLQSGDGPYVLAQSPDGRGLARRPVHLGRTPQGQAVVVSGLTDREPIAVSGAFFLDAELRLAAAAGSSAVGPR